MGLDDLCRDAARLGVFWGLHGYLSRITVKGREYLDVPGPKIVAANHYGGKLDSMLLWTYISRKGDRRVAFPAKKELFYPSMYMLGLNRPVMQACGCIPVDRENPGNIIDEFVRALENGGAYDGTLSIHFEGRTTPKGVLVGKAKTGFARTAMRLPPEHAAKVIPTSVSYKKGTYHSLPAFRAQATLEFLEPIDTAPWKELYDEARDDDQRHIVCQDLTDEVRKRVLADLERKDVPLAPGFPYGILP